MHHVPLWFFEGPCVWETHSLLTIQLVCLLPTETSDCASATGAKITGGITSYLSTLSSSADLPWASEILSWFQRFIPAWFSVTFQPPFPILSPPQALCVILFYYDTNFLQVWSSKYLPSFAHKDSVFCSIGPVCNSFRSLQIPLTELGKGLFVVRLCTENNEYDSAALHYTTQQDYCITLSWPSMAL